MKLLGSFFYHEIHQNFYTRLNIIYIWWYISVHYILRVYMRILLQQYREKENYLFRTQKSGRAVPRARARLDLIWRIPREQKTRLTPRCRITIFSPLRYVETLYRPPASNARQMKHIIYYQSASIPRRVSRVVSPFDKGRVDDRELSWKSERAVCVYISLDLTDATRIWSRAIQRRIKKTKT